ncbi:MAG: hypothetical protein RL030_2440 [Pseudomonadota bacterium]
MSRWPERMSSILPRVLVTLMMLPSVAGAVAAEPVAPPAAASQAAALEASLVARYGEGQRARAHRGIAQVTSRWRAEDGDVAALEALVNDTFAGTPAALDSLFARFEHNWEMIQGHGQEVRRELNSPSDLASPGLADDPITPWDERFAAWNPTAHVLDDLYANQLAFVALLNFPLTSLEERAQDGAAWSQRQWAETRLAENFRQRIPAPVQLAVAKADAENDRYIAGYNLWMGHVLDERGRKLFPGDMRLLSHWNLRDEIKANYAVPKDGLAKQRTLARAMERIIAQEIPEVVIDNPRVDWNPFTNALQPAGNTAREPDARYAVWLANFHAQREIDRYSPGMDTAIARSFERERQIPEDRVQAMFEQVLGSAEFAATAKVVAQRLGRPLEPFDIWYSGFRGGGALDAAKLDDLVAKRYPDATAFQRDLPRILRDLGFAPERADYVASHIVVDPARGSGHAMGAQLRGANAHLRTRIDAGGMNYKGYNIAIHEMCHNVEQTFSLNDVEYFSLNGVPNNAFTEALAFTCQNRDLELLGLAGPDSREKALQALDTFWATAEIAGVALVDMQAWRWMYAHPEATPAEFREAVLGIARDTWNRWFAPVFGVRDATLLAIYSHMINEALYLPDYPIGHMIAFQVEEQMRKSGHFGEDFERMARIGAVNPDLWMMKATGTPVGPEALTLAARKALAELQAGTPR